MGTPSNHAADQANQVEQARRRQLASTTSAINGIFSSPARQGQYSDYLGAERRYYNDDLNRKNADATRQLKFANARSGNTGGSVAIDTGRDLGQNYNRGLLEAERLAQGGVADLRSADDVARLNLIASAANGLDATTGATQAAESARNNLSRARADINPNGVGEIFASFADLFKRNQAAAEQRRGEKDLYGLLYGNGQQYKGGF